MNLFLLNMIFFYVIYWVFIVKKKIDTVMYMYRLEKELSDHDLIEIIKEDERYNLYQSISGAREDGFEGFQKAIKEIDEYTEFEKKLNVSTDYRKKRISKYRRSIKSTYALRGLKIACVTFLSYLWILTPGVVLIATGSQYMLLLALLLTLTKYAMKRDGELTDAIILIKGYEYTQSTYIRIAITLSAIYGAIVTQWYFMTYLILLYIIT